MIGEFFDQVGPVPAAAAGAALLWLLRRYGPRLGDHVWKSLGQRSTVEVARIQADASLDAAELVAFAAQVVTLQATIKELRAELDARKEAGYSLKGDNAALRMAVRMMSKRCPEAREDLNSLLGQTASEWLD